MTHKLNLVFFKYIYLFSLFQNDTYMEMENLSPNIGYGDLLLYFWSCFFFGVQIRLEKANHTFFMKFHEYR